MTRAISELRKVFEDDPRNARVIETIWKEGYRLIAPVHGIDTPGDGPLAPGRAGEPSDRMPALKRSKNTHAQPLSIVAWVGGAALLLLGAAAWLYQGRQAEVFAPAPPCSADELSGQ